MIKILWKVKEHSQHSCGFFKIMYKNKSFYQQTLNLTKAIEHSTKRGVAKIVTDWVLDNQNRYYLIDVKEVELTTPKLTIQIKRSLT